MLRKYGKWLWLILVSFVLLFGSNPDSTVQSATPIPTKIVISPAKAKTLKPLYIIPPQLTRTTTLNTPRWSPDGRFLAATDAHTVYLFSVPDFDKPVQKIDHKTQGILGFTADSSMLITTGTAFDDRFVRAFDVKTGIEHYRIQNKGYIAGINDSSNLLAIRNEYPNSPSIEIYDLYSGMLILTLKGEYAASTINRTGTRIAAVEMHTLVNSIGIWDIETGLRIINLEETLNPQTLAFSPNGELLAVRYVDSYLVIWNAITGEKIEKLSGEYDSFGGSFSLLFSSDSKLLAGIGPGTIHLWYIPSRNLAKTFNDTSYDLFGGTFNLEGNLFLYWGNAPQNGGENWVHIWDVVTEQEVLILKDARDPVFSPVGDMLATWGRNGVTIWGIS